MRRIPFARTVMGNMHELCEDVSECRTLEDGSILFALADGHGDPTYSRSGNGATFATQAAMEHLSRMGEVLLTRDSLTAEELMQVLKAQVVTTWRSLVEQDLLVHPVSEMELVRLGHKKPNQTPIHLYGTTLIAGILREGKYYLIQQGDGSCFAIGKDGQLICPIPEDSRCMGNLTTSISSSSAIHEMRHVIIDSVDVIGLFLASDGVDKSFVDKNATSEFFNWLVLSAQGLTQQEYETFLAKTLEQLRDLGSGDDLSLTGVVASTLDLSQTALLDHAMKRYGLVHSLDEARYKLVSMQRKHDRLQELWNSGYREEASEYPRYHDLYERQCQLSIQLEDELVAFDYGNNAQDTINDIALQNDALPNEGLPKKVEEAEEWNGITSCNRNEATVCSRVEVTRIDDFEPSDAEPHLQCEIVSDSGAKLGFTTCSYSGTYADAPI